ncbi:NAD(+) diphosphatase [Pseudohalocynthiibacter aestuariivivens]|uniref:NAD(+) diphosphatase n=1 Tax=Pseudohalocynthiibacter aestuariivivens TaxID=1591409 RepID=A0ABV5JJ23_9RHOB|nr:NAD(+) diphosphatase [Pseudohalocynthiibacter aestuariivivens]MCK0102247.1 NAD(+) diphosphatase [Pseudohalocynthiibacter sp. F2068]
MKIAEQVTFGGSGLDRLGQLRGQPDRIEAFWQEVTAAVLPVWRGKPLIAGSERNAIGLVATDHELVSLAAEAPVFLGLDRGAPRFSIDVSAWQPEELDDSTLGLFLDPSEQHFPGLPEDLRFTELRSVMSSLGPRDAELIATAKAVLSWHESHQFCAKCGEKTVPAMAGWQRNCPQCNASHFPRTDPVVIMLITHGNDVLMGRSPGWPEGMFSLLAGFVEPGETIEAAVRREAEEESGIRVGRVDYLASQPWPFPTSLMFGCWGEALNRAIVIDLDEIEEAMWVSREEMMKAFAGDHPVLKPARKGAIAHFILSNWLADRLD